MHPDDWLAQYNATLQKAKDDADQAKEQLGQVGGSATSPDGQVTVGVNSSGVVQSCEDTGPITRRGFGHNWNCVTRVQDTKTGKSWTSSIDMNFFTPEDIGKEKKLVWGYGGSRTSHNTEKRTYTRAEGGYSNGTTTTIGVVTTGLVGIPALLMFATSLVWTFPQNEQRKYWEKINGTPEERAAKKKEDDAFWAQIRANRAERKEARQQRKS